MSFRIIFWVNLYYMFKVLPFCTEIPLFQIQTYDPKIQPSTAAQAFLHFYSINKGNASTQSHYLQPLNPKEFQWGVKATKLHKTLIICKGLINEILAGNIYANKIQSQCTESTPPFLSFQCSFTNYYYYTYICGTPCRAASQPHSGHSSSPSSIHSGFASQSSRRGAYYMRTVCWSVEPINQYKATKDSHPLQDC